MPTTTIYALRYPSSSDPADGPVGFQNLAEDVEGKLGGLPVTSLPGSPVDGQIVRYRVTANGPVWVFQYISASTAPKWHFLGGAALYALVATADATNLTTYAALPSAGPTVTVPLAGEYRVSIGSRSSSGAANGFAIHSFDVGATAAADADATVAASSGGTAIANVMREVTKTIAAGSTALTSKYRSTSGTSNFQDRWISALPVRVS